MRRDLLVELNERSRLGGVLVIAALAIKHNALLIDKPGGGSDLFASPVKRVNPVYEAAISVALS